MKLEGESGGRNGAGIGGEGSEDWIKTLYTCVELTNTTKMRFKNNLPIHGS